MTLYEDTQPEGNVAWLSKAVRSLPEYEPILWRSILTDWVDRFLGEGRPPINPDDISDEYRSDIELEMLAATRMARETCEMAVRSMRAADDRVTLLRMEVAELKREISKGSS